MVIQRFTFFQIPEPKDVQLMIEKYSGLQKAAVRNGKPYITTCEADPTLPDQRSKGYTLAVRTTFDTLDDMKYYDDECLAHKDLKAFAMPKKTGDVLIFYFEK